MLSKWGLGGLLVSCSILEASLAPSWLQDPPLWILLFALLQESWDEPSLLSLFQDLCRRVHKVCGRAAKRHIDSFKALSQAC